MSVNEKLTQELHKPVIKKKNYNNFLQKWLSDNDILMYLEHNEGKSLVAERFIKTLKVKIYK